MIGLIRRVVCVAGIFAAIFMYWVTVPDILVVGPVDFEQLYRDEMDPAKGRKMIGGMELALEIAKQETKPKDLAEYVARETDKRLIRVSGPEWVKFFDAVTTPSVQAAWKDRWAGGRIPMTWEESPLQTIRGEISEISANWTYLYLALGEGRDTRYLGVAHGYGVEPKKVKAPASLVFPFRARAWMPLAAGLAVFFVIPRRRPSPGAAFMDYRSAVLPLDALGIVCGTVFFAMPVYFNDPTLRMLGENLGATVLSWGAAALLLVSLFFAAANEAFEILPKHGTLRIRGLLFSSTVDLHNVENVEPLVAHNIESGVVLHMHKGGAVRLCWDGLSNCDGVIQELRQAGLSWKSAESESGGKAGESGTRSCPACGANPPTRAHFCHTCGMRLD